MAPLKESLLVLTLIDTINIREGVSITKADGHLEKYKYILTFHCNTMNKITTLKSEEVRACYDDNLIWSHVTDHLSLYFLKNKNFFCK